MKTLKIRKELNKITGGSHSDPITNTNRVEGESNKALFFAALFHFLGQIELEKKGYSLPISIQINLQDASCMDYLPTTSVRYQSIIMHWNARLG
jgi:hypothetical protein